MNTPLDAEARRKRIETTVKVAVMLVGGFIVAPFVFLAIKGLVGLAIAAVVGLGIVQFAPVVGKTLANWRLKALKAEAARNPVETLQNDYQDRQTALGKFRQAIEAFDGEKMGYADKLETFKKQYPEEADKFDQQLSKMERLLKIRQNKYKLAVQAQAAYALEIKKAGAIWDMSNAAAKMNSAAGLTDEDFLAKIQVETAMDSVQRNLNTAFASLETSLLDDEAASVTKAIEQPKQTTRIAIANDGTQVTSGPGAAEESSVKIKPRASR